MGIHRKRKTDEQQGEESPAPEWNISSSRLPSESINPLSHTPDTLQQLAVAGLSPEDEVPSKTHPLFPHKPISSGDRKRRRRVDSGISGTSRVRGEDDGGAAARREGATAKQYSARLRHLSTLTAVMHRCLGEGDIARAKRAFGLLVQTRDVDIRLGGFWAVGSEILMRDGEKKQQLQVSADSHHHDEEGQPVGGDAGYEGAPRRWGLAANTERAKDYFENLIQQHPHDPHRPHLTSALDFWPALFGIEIYNLDAEFRRALHRLRTTEDDEEAERMEASGEMAYSDEAREEERRDRREVALAARDELRRDTQSVAERIAGHMDQTMANAPYGTHRELLRLRANLALFVGDLCLPWRLMDSDGADVEERKEPLSLNNVEDMLRRRAASAEDYSALARRRAEQGRARGFFQKILDGGGEVDDWVRKFMHAVEEDEQHDVDFEDGW